MNHEEAVRKIRWHLLGLVLTDDMREAFNTLIPELAEKGADEKMLDAILCHVKASNDFTANGVNKEDMVAYLEGKKKKAVIESAYPISIPVVKRYDMVAKLEEHLANTPREQLDAEWKALEKWNDVGPTVEEYIYGKLPKFKVGDKIRKIGGDYASWEITGINNILRIYEGKYEEGYPTELSFEEQDSYELATGEPINTENNTVDVPVPELRESDDAMVLERIKKCVIYDCSITQEETDECLAYLEKQKDLPTNEEMLRTLRAEYEKGIADTIAKYEQKAEWSEEDKDYYDTIVRKLEVIGDDSGLSDNQIKFLREHCPLNCSEWNEEDEKMRQSIIKDIEFDRNYTYATTGKVSEKYNEQINWLKVLFLNRKKINEDVEKLCSNEWSEEDEDMFNDILLDMADRREMFKSKGETTFADNTQKKIDWFDSHHVQLKYSSCSQPKQEWSEEEKRKLNRIYEILGYAADDRGFLKSKRIIGDKEAIELQDFLKSLSLNLKKKNKDVTKLCSNEWSEEEYGRLFDIEHYLDGTLQLSPDRKIACIVFLKSLRLQPKHEWSEEEKMNIELLIALLRGKVNLVEVLGSRKEMIITFLKSLYSRKPKEVRYYEAWGVPKINGVPVPTENQTVDISGDVRLKGWVKRKTADGTLRLYESKSCEDRGIWVPPWVLKDSWKICTTDDPIEVEITLKQL